MSECINIANPYYVQLHLLADCIFNCSYCYLKGYDRKSMLSKKQINTFLNKFNNYYQDFGLRVHINLTGGDIWLYEGISEIFFLLKKHKVVQDFSLLLNSLWHEDSYKIIKDNKNSISLVQLNIDAINNRDKDIQFLSKEKIRFVIKILLSNNEHYYIKQLNILRKLLRKYPDLLVSIDRICPTNQSNKKMRLSVKNLKKKLLEIRSIANNVLIVDDPLVSAFFNKAKSESEKGFWNGCVIPSGGLAVYPNGEVKLCARIPNYTTGFTINNFTLEHYIDSFSEIRNQQMKNCNKCPISAQCQGGCPATSFIDKNIITKDHQCLYE